MSVPKKKRTKGSGGKRRSHDALNPLQLTTCPKCKKTVKPHTVCPSCGTYKGEEKVKKEVSAKK